MEITMHAGETFLVYDEAGVKREVTSEEFVSKEAGDEVDRRARQYMRDHPEVAYDRAVDIVLDADEPLKKNYARR